MNNGDAMRDRGAGKTYRKLHGRHEHRVVAEKKLGRRLRPGETVHHKDHNKRNNDPKNIEVFKSQAEHARFHMRERHAANRN
jgi:HNH endonuclease